jgi:hypothetical protein
MRQLSGDGSSVRRESAIVDLEWAALGRTAGIGVTRYLDAYS